MDSIAEKKRLLVLLDLLSREWRINNHTPPLNALSISNAFDLMHEHLSRLPENSLSPPEMREIWRFWGLALNQMASGVNQLTPELIEKLPQVGFDLFKLGFNPWTPRPQEGTSNSDEVRYDAYLIINGSSLRWMSAPFLQALLVDNLDAKLSKSFWHKLLNRAIPWSNIPLAEFAIDHGADPNWHNPKTGATSLFAVKTSVMLKWLLEHGADINQQNSMGSLCSYSWTGSIREELLKTLLDVQTGTSVEQKRDLAFDGFAQCLLENNSASLSVFNEKLRSLGLKTNSTKSSGLSILALSADSALLNNNRFGWLKMVLNKKVDLEHESNLGVPDAFWAYAVASHSSDYGRTQTQISAVREMLQSHASITQFLQNEDYAKKVVTGLLEIPERFQHSKANSALWAHNGIVARLSSRNSCTWSSNSTLPGHPHPLYGALGWGMLCSGANLKNTVDGMDFTALTHLNQLQDWSAWPAPTPLAVDKLLLSLVHSSFYNEPENGIKLLNKIEETGVLPSEEGVEKLFKVLESRRIHDTLRARLEKIRFQSLPSAPKSSKMRL